MCYEEGQDIPTVVGVLSVALRDLGWKGTGKKKKNKPRLLSARKEFTRGNLGNSFNWWHVWRTGPEYTRNQHLDVQKCGKNYATKRISSGAAADTGQWMTATELIPSFTLPWCHLLAIQCPVDTTDYSSYRLEGKTYRLGLFSSCAMRKDLGFHGDLDYLIKTPNRMRIQMLSS